jgi:hypothetical protein
VGCLKALFVQIGCLLVLLAGAVLAFIYREQLWDLYRRARGLPPRVDMVFVAPAPGGADAARRSLRELARSGGPAFVDLSAAELAALVDEELSRVPRRAFDSVEIGLGEGEARLRGLLDLSGVPRRLLGPLAQGFERRERVTAGGPLSVDSAGGVVWTGTSLSVRDFPFPRSTIPAILRALGVGLVGDGVPLLAGGVPGAGSGEGGVAGDVRVNRERVRLYRASQR